MIANYPIEALVESRQDKDVFFKTDSNSPLTEQQRSVFEGLRYFPPNPALAFEITPIKFVTADQIAQRIMTNQNEIRHYRRWGRLEFEVNGQSVGLTLFQDQGGEYFFLPFADPTNGDKTYGAGRYVEVELLPDGQFRLDLNSAYNPFCAYNEPHSLVNAAGRHPRTWNCPLVPPENRLAVPIEAGEQKPVGAWVEHVSQ